MIPGTENFVEYCREYLEEKWQKINMMARENLKDFLGEEHRDLKSLIVDCLNSTTKSYHYVLPTQLLSKAVEQSRDCRSLQASYGKAGAFDARAIVHKVVVPFDKANHNVLGGSAEPYVNNPLRCPSVTLEYEKRQKNKEDWRKLVKVLEFVEQADEPYFTESAFKQVLAEIFRMMAEVEVLYPTPNRISLDKTIQLINTFVAESSGGDRIEAVTTALFQEIADRFGLFEEIRRERVNAADSSSGMAADIECYADGRVVLLVEVKDRALTLIQLESKLDTARARKIKEILFIAERGIEQNNMREIEEKIKSEFTSGQNIYIVNFIEFAHSLLILFGEEGRVSFLTRIGKELDRVNSSIFHRKAWGQLLKEV
jgi:hypothetical protein